MNLILLMLLNLYPLRDSVLVYKCFKIDTSSSATWIKKIGKQGSTLRIITCDLADTFYIGNDSLSAIFTIDSVSWKRSVDSLVLNYPGGNKGTKLQHVDTSDYSISSGYSDSSALADTSKQKWVDSTAKAVYAWDSDKLDGHHWAGVCSVKVNNAYQADSSEVSANSHKWMGKDSTSDFNWTGNHSFAKRVITKTDSIRLFHHITDTTGWYEKVDVVTGNLELWIRRVE